MEESAIERSEGVKIRKVQNAYNPHTLVLYYITSSNDHAVDIAVLDQIPLTVPRDAIQFYADYRSENWELFEDNQALWSGTIESGETVVTAYAVQQGNMKLPGYAPEILSVTDPADDDNPAELLWRRSTVKSLPKNVVEYDPAHLEDDSEGGLLEIMSEVLSHDVENLLMVTNGRLELATKTGEPEHVEEAATVLGHVEDLVSDLVDLARTGQQVTALEPLDLETVATQAWYEDGQSDATLEIESTGTVVADESSLRQLLDNLFRNAVDHGGDDVTITVGSLDEYGFYVEDDGSGISASEREQIFEAGYSTSEQSGIGLCIVQRLAESHGWAIDVRESTTGGARFEFRPQ